MSILHKLIILIAASPVWGPVIDGWLQKSGVQETRSVLPSFFAVILA